jgi:hypothetical protein
MIGGCIMSQITVKEITYKSYGKCVEVSNGEISLVVTVDVGPRIIRFGFINGENEFTEDAPMTKQVEAGEWRLMGGHRLWHSPEGDPRSYVPDNDPVEWSQVEGGIKVSQRIEPWVQTKKEMEITLSSSSNKVRVVHRLTNKNAWPIEVSAWALSVMAVGGLEIVPQPQRDTGLLGNRLIALWPYSKMNDGRIYWGEKYITLKQDTDYKTAFKYGIPNEDGWAAYLNHGNLFIKRFEHQLGAKYPDFGCSYETFTIDFMLEMESLSPLTLLDYDETINHVEEWELIKGVEVPASEKEIDLLVERYI